AFVLAKDEVVLASLALGMALLPLATGAAVLRYRLYDLDRIISRTLTYGLLTVLLGGGYAGIVLGVAQRLGAGAHRAGAGLFPAAPPPHPTGVGPPLQPPQVQYDQDHRGVLDPPT